MSVYTWPTAVVPRSVQLRLLPAVRLFTSPYNRQTQAVDLMAETWRLQMALPPMTDKTLAGSLEALFDRLKGQVHQVNLWHFGRPAPQGTMRGAPTLSANAAQLANTVSISGTGTLLAGDMIGIGGQLCRVMADVTLPGSVEIAPRLRTAKSSGTAVTWDKPTATFMLATPDGVPLVYEPGMQQGPDVEWMEKV